MIATSVIQEFLGGGRVTCCRCKRPVERIAVAALFDSPNEYEVTFTCSHGTTANYTARNFDRETTRIEVDPYRPERTKFPRKVFLPNWAAHGGSSSEARRERRRRIEAR